MNYVYAREGLLNKFQEIQARSLFKERKNPRDSTNLVRQAKRGRTSNDGVSAQDGKGSNNAIDHTERYCFKMWSCQVCGLEHNQ